MVAPKRKTSGARRDKRRSSVWKLSAPAIIKCKSCGELILAHRICKNCGNYDGRKVIAVSDDKK